MPAIFPGGAGTCRQKTPGLGFVPLTLKGWRALARFAHLAKRSSSPSLTWAARGVWSGRSLSARTASGSQVLVASPQLDF